MLMNTAAARAKIKQQNEVYLENVQKMDSIFAALTDPNDEKADFATQISGLPASLLPVVFGAALALKHNAVLKLLCDKKIDASFDFNSVATELEAMQDLRLSIPKGLIAECETHSNDIIYPELAFIFAFYQAIDDVQAINELIALLDPADCTQTLLRFAVGRNLPDLVRAIREKNETALNPNAVVTCHQRYLDSALRETDCTLLMYAAKQDFFDVVEELLKFPAIDSHRHRNTLIGKKWFCLYLADGPLDVATGQSKEILQDYENKQAHSNMFSVLHPLRVSVGLNLTLIIAATVCFGLLLAPVAMLVPPLGLITAMLVAVLLGSLIGSFLGCGVIPLTLYGLRFLDKKQQARSASLIESPHDQRAAPDRLPAAASGTSCFAKMVVASKGCFTACGETLSARSDDLAIFCCHWRPPLPDSPRPDRGENGAGNNKLPSVVEETITDNDSNNPRCNQTMF